MSRQCMAAWVALVVLVVVFLPVGGCSAPSRLSAVPREQIDHATLPGFGTVRWWGDIGDEPAFLDALRLSVHRETEERAAKGESGPLPPAHFLAVSGGGANGAYGAGLLCGWTDSGTRPEFKIVTGISTGALIAPFAFMGRAYDHVLREVYTNTATRDIAQRRGVLSALYSDAMADTRPLARLIHKHVTPELLEEIAKEYARGRLLLIGTTNLDAGRPVVWNLGAIAATGTPEARELICELLRASAAIPAAFPPVLVDVKVDGETHQEMHVDGGTSTQVFLYPPSFLLAKEAAAADVKRDRTLWVIRNARLDPNWAETRRQTLSIAGRAISSLIQTQGLGDLLRLYAVSRRDNVTFRLAFIPSSFQLQAEEAFDVAYMRELFDVGLTHGFRGDGWFAAPPEVTPDQAPVQE